MALVTLILFFTRFTNHFVNLELYGDILSLVLLVLVMSIIHFKKFLESATIESKLLIFFQKLILADIIVSFILLVYPDIFQVISFLLIFEKIVALLALLFFLYYSLNKKDGIKVKGNTFVESISFYFFLSHIVIPHKIFLYCGKYGHMKALALYVLVTIISIFDLKYGLIVLYFLSFYFFIFWSCIIYSNGSIELYFKKNKNSILLANFFSISNKSDVLLEILGISFRPLLSFYLISLIGIDLELIFNLSFFVFHFAIEKIINNLNQLIVLPTIDKIESLLNPHHLLTHTSVVNNKQTASEQILMANNKTNNLGDFLRGSGTNYKSNICHPKVAIGIQSNKVIAIGSIPPEGSEEYITIDQVYGFCKVGTSAKGLIGVDNISLEDAKNHKTITDRITLVNPLRLRAFFITIPDFSEAVKINSTKETVMLCDKKEVVKNEILKQLYIQKKHMLRYPIPQQVELSPEEIAKIISCRKAGAVAGAIVGLSVGIVIGSLSGGDVNDALFFGALSGGVSGAVAGAIVGQSEGAVAGGCTGFVVGGVTTALTGKAAGAIGGAIDARTDYVGNMFGLIDTSNGTTEIDERLTTTAELTLSDEFDEIRFQNLDARLQQYKEILEKLKNDREK